MTEIDDYQMRICRTSERLKVAREADKHLSKQAQEVIDMLPADVAEEVKTIPVRAVFQRDLNAMAILFPSGAKAITMHLGTPAILYNLYQNVIRGGEEEWDEKRGYEVFHPLALYAIDPFTHSLPSLPGGLLEQVFGAFGADFVEKFILAHELFHFICGHIGDAREHSIYNELEADRRAIKLLGALQTREPEMFLPHLDVLFTFMEFCERLRGRSTELATHPSARERREQAREFYREKFPAGEGIEYCRAVQLVFEDMWSFHKRTPEK